MGPYSPRSRASTAICLPIAILLSILSLFACTNEPAPDLLDIERIEPASIEQGTELRILGSGFAQRHPGTLSLKGTLFSAGRPARALQWSTSIEPETRSAIQLRMTERALSELLDGAHHGTFQGAVEVAFAPIMPGRPTLRGQREGVRLDFFSDEKPSTEHAHNFISYLGVQLSPTFVIEELVSGGPASQAGLAVGDRLVELDSVHLDSFADFAPMPHVTASTINYVRGGSTTRTEQVTVARASFQVLDAALTAKSLAFALGLGLAFVLLARPPRFIVWLLGHQPGKARQNMVWLEGLGQTSQSLAYVCFALVAGAYFLLVNGGIGSAALGGASFGGAQLHTLQHLDFLVLLSGGIIVILMGSFVLGGTSEHRGFSLLGAFTSTMSSLFLLLPVVVGALSRAAEVGSLQLTEIDASQGQFPPQLGALESPWSLFLAGGYLLALVPLSGRRPPVFGQSGAPSSRLLLGRVLEWIGLLTLVALGLSLFGGAHLNVTQGSLLLRSAVFCLKLALVVYGLTALRARCGYPRANEVWGLWGGFNLLQSAFCTGLLLLSWMKCSSALTFELKNAFTLALFGSFVILVGLAQARSWLQSGRQSDPWI